jgi:hypothetical protein
VETMTSPGEPREKAPSIRRSVPPSLAGLVHRITCYDGDGARGGDREMASFVVPVIFSFADPFRIAFDREPTPGDRIGSFVSGLHAGYVDIAYGGPVSCVQIDLTPIGRRPVLPATAGGVHDAPRPAGRCRGSGPDGAARQARHGPDTDREAEDRGGVCRTSAARSRRRPAYGLCLVGNPAQPGRTSDRPAGRGPWLEPQEAGRPCARCVRPDAQAAGPDRALPACGRSCAGHCAGGLGRARGRVRLCRPGASRTGVRRTSRATARAMAARRRRWAGGTNLQDRGLRARLRITPPPCRGDATCPRPRGSTPPSATTTLPP